ncbi:MAG: Rho termination factor N-terminal domain-containing protein, partial [Muribaculaceae bacterium]|nr:Rho termination factor N-terminal domain-containing protein [Muribaculaceae bacterium]
MYNITDLERMSDDDLKKIAGDLGLKKIDSIEKQELIFSILDEQAIAGAAARAAQQRAAADGAEPKKRGRKKKETSDNQPAASEPAAEPAAAKPKRGRKAEAEPVAAEPATQPEVTLTPEATEAEAQPKKRRGRPSKKELEERRLREEAENNATAQAVTTPAEPAPEPAAE